MKERPDRPFYKDYIFRAVACLLAAHVIVMMGRPDLTSFEAFLIPSYYPTLFINYVIALIVGMAVKKVTIALDKKHDWYRDIWRRAMLQFSFGVLAVSILSFLLVWLYFVCFGQDIVESGYLDYELPFSIALITILNFYYVAYYFYMYPRQSNPVDTSIELIPEIEQPPSTDSLPLAVSMEDNPSEVKVVREIRSYSFSVIAPAPLALNGNKKETKEILIIDTPKRSIPIRVQNVLMFFIFEKTVFVRKKDMKSFNDCYQIQMNLTEVMELLDEQDFFRISRQCIVNINAIGSYQALTTKTLLITLRKEFGKLENIDDKEWQKLATVAEDRVNEFKKWINR